MLGTVFRIRDPQQLGGLKHSEMGSAGSIERDPNHGQGRQRRID